MLCDCFETSKTKNTYTTHCATPTTSVYILVRTTGLPKVSAVLPTSECFKIEIRPSSKKSFFGANDKQLKSSNRSWYYDNFSTNGIVSTKGFF